MRKWHVQFVHAASMYSVHEAKPIYQRAEVEWTRIQILIVETQRDLCAHRGRHLEKQQTMLKFRCDTVDRIRVTKVYASCPGWPSEGVIRALQSNNTYTIPHSLQLPTYN